MDDIMLSIVVPTYNHERYIKKALDSILMQETSYSYEILVGEDCSTDGTREVLRNYEKKHPGKLQVFYREKNLSAAKYWNWADLARKTKGKYLITLEGDDFWLSTTKIHQQIEFLEKHPEYIAVAHNCIVVDQYGNPNGEIYPECKTKEYTLWHYLCEIFPGQLTTVMCRNFERQDILDKGIIESHMVPGDRVLYFALANRGKIYCMQNAMSAYRHVTQGGSSYSANVKFSFVQAEIWHRTLLEYAKRQGKLKGILVLEALYLSLVIHGLRMHMITWSRALSLFRNIAHPVLAISIGGIRYLFLHSFKNPYKHFS